MLVIGLTGGIGSGKTAVSDAFQRRGIPVIDTDILARELVKPGQPALAEIVGTFGSACLDPSGTLNRSYLRQTVFADPAQRRRLEAILHPRIRQTLAERLATLTASYCLVVVPLLTETAMADLFHRILVVDIPEDVQVQRVMTRDHVDKAHARRILRAQATRAQRLALAHDVLDNSDSLREMDDQVAALHEKYLALSTEGGQ
jgi:dephospho-CoA kinase